MAELDRGVLEDNIPKVIDKEHLRPGQPVFAEKLYFYERPNGTVFECRAREAEAAHKKFKQVGVSDGNIAAKAITELQKNYKALSLEEIQAGIRKAMADELEAGRGHFEKPPDFRLETYGDKRLYDALKDKLL